MTKFKLADFKTWLTQNGAEIEPPTNPWEILCVRTCEGFFVAHTNKAGIETWPDGLEEIKKAFLKKVQMPLNPALKNRRRLRHMIVQISARDGLECWFCEIGFLNSDSQEISIEHVCPRSHGGPDHISNLVLACSSCNNEVGNLSVAEKVSIRDRKRGFVCEPVRACA